MNNSPLSSREQNKVIIFIFLLLPTVFVGVGILPVAFLLFGYFLMRKNEDFGRLEAAVRIFKIYIYFITLIGFLFVFFLVVVNSSIIIYSEIVYVTLALAAVTYMYFFMIDELFLKPIADRREWVIANGLFASKEKLANKQKSGQTEIIKADKFKSYSVAEELMRWAQLREAGHISEQEYDDAKGQLLKKS